MRAFAGSPTSVDTDTRSFDIVITTETPVRTSIPDPRIVDVETQDCSYIEVDEVLLTKGLDYSRTPRMPLLDSHDSYSSIDKIAGKIEHVRAEGQSVVGRAFLTSKRADLLPDIAEGFYGQCSAGYCVLEYELTERPDVVPLAVAKRWLLTEASLVAVGADLNSFIRSVGAPAAPKVTYHPLPKSQEKNMKNLKRGLGRKRADEGTMPDAPALDDVIAQAEKAVAAAEAAVDALDEAVSAAGDDAGDEVMERAAALRSRFRAAEDETEPDADKKADDEDNSRSTTMKIATPLRCTVGMPRASNLSSRRSIRLPASSRKRHARSARTTSHTAIMTTSCRDGSSGLRRRSQSRIPSSGISPTTR